MGLMDNAKIADLERRVTNLEAMVRLLAGDRFVHPANEGNVERMVDELNDPAELTGPTYPTDRQGR